MMVQTYEEKQMVDFIDHPHNLDNIFYYAS